ncbi:hypothetical protein [Nocardioides terrigena]|uniref:hypothetical protein n=1 Tax=Nocardioides terrigena TaxID=424797 RepID=UPI00131F378C|nr:hypothetical protein [Nocardioides terrigena]
MAVALVSLLMTACGQERSAEAYCSTMDEYKKRYLEAWASADEQASSGSALGALEGLSRGMGAMGDLAQMWEALSEVAPDEIRQDTESVRDAYESQLESSKESADNALGAFASSLMAGLQTAPALGRIDEYVRVNCG